MRGGDIPGLPYVSQGVIDGPQSEHHHHVSTARHQNKARDDEPRVGQVVQVLITHLNTKTGGVKWGVGDTHRTRGRRLLTEGVGSTVALTI